MNSTATIARHPLAAAVRSEAAALAVIALCALATRAVWFGDSAASPDEQLYSLIGNAMLEGSLPFVDLWDRKPIGLFALFAVAHWLGGPDPIAYQLLAAFFAMLGGWLVFALARPLGGTATGVVAALVYLLLTAAYGSYAGQSEIFHVPLVLAMVLLVRDGERPDALRRAAWAMLLGGLALQVKYSVLPQCLFLGCYALLHLQREGFGPGRLAGAAALFGTLGLLPTAAALGLYAAMGALEPFVFANFVSFFDRLPSGAGRLPLRHLPLVAPLFLLAAAGLWAAWRVQRPTPARHYRLIACWALSALATVLLPGTVYLYYYAALAPAAALLALPLYDCRVARGRWMALAIVAACALLVDYPGRHSQSQQRREALAQLAAAAIPAVRTGDRCLFVYDGPTSLYRLTGSCLPSRFAYPDHLNNALETPALGVDQAAEVARILRTGPAAIVTADSPLTPQAPRSTELVSDALASRYKLEMQREMDERTISLWLRTAP
ncbi:MAG TPA: glycosyltransferase family 39 protein [Croceibacterium sp.]